MTKLKDAARKSGLFIVTDSDLDFNQPVVRVKIDRSKASDLGITMQSIGSALATLLGGNYVNRFNLEGRSYQVIPQVPRGQRLVAEIARQLLCPDHDRAAGAALDHRVGRDRRRSERADALQPAQLRRPSRPCRCLASRWGRRWSSWRAKPRSSRPASAHDFLADSRQYVQRGQSAAGYLRVRDHHHLPGAGGAVREPARSVRDHDLACRWRSSAP